MAHTLQSTPSRPPQPRSPHTALAARTALAAAAAAALPALYPPAQTSSHKNPYIQRSQSTCSMSIIIRVFSSSGQRRVTVAPTATLNDVHAAFVKDLQTVIVCKAAQVTFFADRECTVPYPDMSLALSSLGLNKNGSMIFAKHPSVGAPTYERGDSSSPPPTKGGNVR